MQNNLPTPLARAAMRALPAHVLQRMIDTLLRSMRVGHPKLFRNLERLSPAVVYIDPLDIPHCFRLAYGKGEASLMVTGSIDTSDANAVIKGKLDVLINMLEGRTDGDTLFFSRGIEIAGDTSAVVALRNTLDREEIDLLDDVAALFGPFARPVHAAAALMDRTARRIKTRIMEICDEASETRANTNAAKKECDQLRAEVQALKTRLSKLEVYRQQSGPAR